MKKLFITILFLLAALTLLAETWKIIKSTHFIIHYNKADITFIDRLKDHLENYYQKITDEIGFTRYSNFWIWENRAKIYVYDTKKDYKDNTKQPDWSVAVADTRNKIINTYFGAQEKDFFDKVILHELAHLIFREFVGFGDNVWLWLDEGVAEFFSKDHIYIEESFRHVINTNKYIPLKDLSKKSLEGLNDEQVKLFYVESGAVIFYLIKNFGKTNFVGFCRALSNGKDIDAALYSNYPIKNVEELNNRLINYFNNER